MYYYEIRFFNSSWKPTLIFEGSSPSYSDALVTLRDMSAVPCWSVEVWQETDCVYRGPMPINCQLI